MYKKGEKFFKDENVSPEERILHVRGEQGLKNIGLENHLYNPEVEGIRSDDLEEIFQEYGENFYDTTISEIETLAIGSNIPQTIKDRLCLMMASMRVRTPLFKHEIEEMDEGMRKHFMATRFASITPEEIVNQCKELTDREVSLEMAASIRETFVNKKYDLKYPNGLFIKYALLLLEHHADIFHQMILKICKSDGRFLITSDNPLVYFVPKEHLNAYVGPKALVSPHSEVFFPLTKNLGAYLTWRKGDETLVRASREIVDAFNFNLSHHSLNYIFSSTKIGELEKFTQEHVPYPFKFTIR